MPNVVYPLLRRLLLPLIVLVLVYAVSTLGFVLIPGQDDQGRPWHMDFFHAFYFVSFMGSTIGFGEIPYPFTEAQRAWTTVSIYATVIAWLYGIGALLTTLQDPAFRRLMVETRFRRAVRHLREPFYLVCGYGDTGSQLVAALAEEGIMTVVVDIREERIREVELSDLPYLPPALCADASVPSVLQQAGLESPHCRALIALTDDDEANLAAAVAAHLLNPSVRVIARAERPELQANIASFGANDVLNPYELFAGRLALALHSPGMYVLFEWMTGVPHEPLQEPLFPPHGRWILCGYGRFGKAVYRRLAEEGVQATVVEADPERTDAPWDAVVGVGTQPDTLEEAGIHEALGIVAGTDNDINNLSIIATARELNPNLFMVARQNQTSNDPLFAAANLALVMKRGSVIAHKIFALLRTPLIGDFLDLAREQGNDWANQLVSRILGVVTDEVPQIWEVEITPDGAPGFFDAPPACTPTVDALRRDPRDRSLRLECIPLLLRRGTERLLLPGEDTPLEEGDHLLFCGSQVARSEMEWIVNNVNALHYVLTGVERPHGAIWRWLRRGEHPACPG